MKWYIKVLRNYVKFSGRARRREYWWFILISMLITIVLTLIDYQRMGLLTADFAEKAKDIEPSIGISSIYGWGVLLPTIGVSVRRLHDQNRSGWWLLLGFVPQVALAIMLMATGQTRQVGNAEDAVSVGFMAATGILALFLLFGALVLLVMMFLDGTAGPNRFGPDPKGRGDGVQDEVWPEIA